MNWGHPEKGKVLLLAGDIALALAAVLLARFARPGSHLDPWRQAAILAAFAAVYTASFYIFDLYNVRSLNGLRTFSRLAAASVFATAGFSVMGFALRTYFLGRTSLALAAALLVLTASAWRAAYKKHYSVMFRNRGVVLIGDREDASFLEGILKAECSPYELRGFLPFDASDAGLMGKEHWRKPLAAAAAVGNLHPHSAGADSINIWDAPEPVTPESESAFPGWPDAAARARAQLERAAAELDVDTIVLRQGPVTPDLAMTLTELRFHGIRIATMPDLCSEVLETLPLDALSEEWFSFAAGFPVLHQKLFRKIKRISDILFAALGLVLSLPISLAAAAAIRLDSTGPILFRQWRVGRMEKPFLVLKFRSMLQGAEPDGSPRWAAAADSRVTRVGRILRTLHIDEIPQMINVLRGEMSFIGPRPERPEFVELLKTQISFYSLRHSVPPGITGWAQVNYPYGSSVQDAKRKLEFDLYYVRNASPTLDLRILLRTVRVIIFRMGSR